MLEELRRKEGGREGRLGGAGLFMRRESGCGVGLEIGVLVEEVEEVEEVDDDEEEGSSMIRLGRYIVDEVEEIAELMTELEVG